MLSELERECLPVATCTGEKETLFSTTAVHRSIGFEISA